MNPRPNTHPAPRQQRTEVIELDGILQRVPATYHPHGPLVGRMVTTCVLQAGGLHGVCPVPVAMPLHRPTFHTDPRLVVIDDLAEEWVMGFAVVLNQQRYRISGFWQQTPQNAFRPLSGYYR